MGSEMFKRAHLSHRAEEESEDEAAEEVAAEGSPKDGPSAGSAVSHRPAPLGPVKGD